MRLLYVTERASRHDLRFMDALVAKGHEVLLHPLKARGDAGLDASTPGRTTLGGAALSDLKARARDLGVDVIHAGPLPTAGFVAARANLRPLVTCSWAFDVLLDARNDRRVEERVRAALAASDAVIVDALVVERALRSDYGYEGRVARFPWGTDLDVFYPRAAGDRSGDLAKGTHVVICTRAWEPLYRTDLVVEAFALASAREPSLRLILANDGSQSPLIRRRLAMRSIENLVTLPGHVSESELAALMRRSDTYISASPVDGTSVSLLQALASGLLTVCADIPGNREWLRNWPGSRLVDAQDPQSWADAILETTSLDPARERRVRARNRSVAERRADWRINSRHLISTYEDAASGG